MSLKLYKFLNFIASPILFALVIIRLFKGKESRDRFEERFGIPSFKTRPEGKLIWFHATSVGEVASILPTLENLAQNKRFSGALLLTSTTLGSIRLLEKRNLPKKIIHQFCPIDNFFTVKNFINFWKPNLAVFVESEFWPYTLSHAAAFCNVISLNTSISDKSFKRWTAFKFFTNDILKKIKKFFPKSITDLQKLKSLGFNNAEHIGNLKYSVPILPFKQEDLKELKKSIKKRKVILFASTHPGENELAIEIFKTIKKKYPSLLCILIPRHINRIKTICNLIQKASLSFILRSKSTEKIPSKTDFYIVNTIGETGLFFALSPITIMGGSFVNIGGHNLIEPTKLNSVAISGPYTDNFKDIVEEFKKNKAACFVKTHKHCAILIKKLLDDKNLLNTYKKNAKELLRSKNNILKQISDNLIKYIN